MRLTTSNLFAIGAIATVVLVAPLPVRAQGDINQGGRVLDGPLVVSPPAAPATPPAPPQVDTSRGMVITDGPIGPRLPQQPQPGAPASPPHVDTSRGVVVIDGPIGSPPPQQPAPTPDNSRAVHIIDGPTPEPTPQEPAPPPPAQVVPPAPALVAPAQPATPAAPIEPTIAAPSPAPNASSLSPLIPAGPGLPSLIAPPTPSLPPAQATLPPLPPLPPAPQAILPPEPPSQAVLPPASEPLPSPGLPSLPPPMPTPSASIVPLPPSPSPPAMSTPYTEPPGDAPNAPAPEPAALSPPAEPIVLPPAGTKFDVANTADVSVEIQPGQYINLGTRVSFRVTTKKPGYLILVDVDSAGKLTQIYPNPMALMPTGSTNANTRVNLIKPGKPIEIPDAKSGIASFEFVASPPRGVAMVVAILSDRPVQLVDLPDIPASLIGQAGALAYLNKMASELRVPPADGDGPLSEPKWSLNGKFYAIQ